MRDNNQISKHATPSPVRARGGQAVSGSAGFAVLALAVLAAVLALAALAGLAADFRRWQLGGLGASSVPSPWRARRQPRLSLLVPPSCGACAALGRGLAGFALLLAPPPPVAARASSSGSACSSVTVSGVDVRGQRGVDAVMADIGAVAALLDHHRATLVGMVAERAAGIGAEAAAFAGIELLLGDQRDRAIEPDVEHVVAGLEIGVGLAVLDVGAEAADAGQDRLAVLRMLADLARQRQQAERALEVDVVGGEPLGHAGALGLLAVRPPRRAGCRGRSGPSAASLRGRSSGSSPSFFMPPSGAPLPPSRTGGCSGIPDSWCSR